MKRDKIGWTLPDPKISPTNISSPSVTAEQLEQRDKAMKAAFGIFKGRDVFPEDGLEYQLEVRAEWR